MNCGEVFLEINRLYMRYTTANIVCESIYGSRKEYSPSLPFIGIE